MNDTEGVTMISPAPDATSFAVDGVVYTLEPELTVERAKAFQKLQVELAYDTSLQHIIKAVNRGWGALESGKIATGIHEFGKLRESLNGIGEDRLSNVNIVALFYNAPGEDLGYNHTAMLAKMAKWGRVANGFFTVVAFKRLTATSLIYPFPAAEPLTTPLANPTTLEATSSD